jgi:excisionase family DNA binding protein
MDVHRLVDAGATTEITKPLALSVKDACRIIGVGNTTLWKLIADGQIRTIRIGRKRLVIYASLEALLSERA